MGEMTDEPQGASGTALDYFATARDEINRATTEDALLHSIIAEARLRGWLAYHARPARTKHGRWVTPMQGDAGFPDLVLVRPPRVVFIECKSERGRLSPEQSAWLDALFASAAIGGVETYIIRPRDRDRISGILA